MVTNNVASTNDDLTFRRSADSEPKPQQQRQPHGSGLAPPYPPAPPMMPGPPLMYPLAPPHKKVKTNEHTRFGGPQPPPPIHSLPLVKGHHSHSAVPPMPQVLPAPVLARSRASVAQPITPQQNPYSTSRGLRHFSMKVCEKVEEKGTTTYNEVADELVRELKQAEEAINMAAAARGEAPIKKKRKSSCGKTKKNHDDKNIRRRVYDALNVLMAMDIITKDKKEITWRGLPGNRVSGGSDSEGPSPSNRHRDGLSRPQRVQRLQEELAKRQEAVCNKRDCLEELMVQNVCFHNLLGRNHAKELHTHRRESFQKISVNYDDPNESKCEVKAMDEKIPLPFLIVSTDSRAVIQCEMCPKRTNISFDFSLPFEISDDNEILKRLGMNYSSKEALQRSLPPDVFYYCNENGLLDGITRSK